jgi:hypothetical protein
MKTIVLITLLLLVPASGQVSAGALESKTGSVGISTDSCGFGGNCTHYVVVVNADGSGSYIGLEGVGTEGAVTLKVSKSSYDSIIQQLKRVNFFKLRESYTSKEDGCVEMWTDQGSTTFYAVRDDKVKKIDIYRGCRVPGVTKNLIELDEFIHKVTGTDKLIEDAK